MEKIGEAEPLPSGTVEAEELPGRAVALQEMEARVEKRDCVRCPFKEAAVLLLAHLQAAGRFRQAADPFLEADVEIREPRMEVAEPVGEDERGSHGEEEEAVLGKDEIPVEGDGVHDIEDSCA